MKLVGVHRRVGGTSFYLNVESKFSSGENHESQHIPPCRRSSFHTHSRVDFCHWKLHYFSFIAAESWALEQASADSSFVLWREIHRKLGLFCFTWLDAIDGLIRSLSLVNIISHKNPQKRLKNVMIHLFTHKWAMEYRIGANTPKMTLKCH